MNVLMPQLGETVAEGKVAVWYKKEGDIVSKNEILADVETEKAAVEIPSPVEEWLDLFWFQKVKQWMSELRWLLLTIRMLIVVHLNSPLMLKRKFLHQSP